MRRAIPFAILGACLAVGVLPALAADQSVAIHDFSFTPNRVAVMPGQQVTWSGNTTSQHNVHFDGEVAPLAAPSMNFNASRTFDTEGTYRYHCDVHAFMTGTVYVNQSGTVPAPTATPSPSATPTPTPTPTPSGGGSGGGGSGSGSSGGSGTTSAPGSSGGTASTEVTSFRVRAVHGAFCTRRTATCKKPGIFLVVKLGAQDAVRVRGTLKRGARRVRAITLRVQPGRHRVRLPGRPLRPGRYALTLRAGDFKRRVRFRVRGS